MTTLILARHGHADWIAPERFGGREELPLSKLGEQQATALPARVAQNRVPDAIYTSPLSRCRRTGDAIVQLIGASTKILDDLSDID